MDDVEPDAVRLMSIHAAKGLEFPVVCVADLGREQNLGVPDLIVDGELVGLRLARLRRGDERAGAVAMSCCPSGASRRRRRRRTGSCTSR